MLDAFDPPYVQRALLEIVLLAIAAGALGTWVVLRGLSFYSHAVGTAAFPGLVLADGLGFAPLVGAAGAAAVLAVVVAFLARRQPGAYDSLTAMALVAALAVGVILASDVFHSSGSVERLLFGSLLLVDTADQVLAAAVSVVAVAAGTVLGRRWLATGFDREGTRALGVRAGGPELLLLGLTAAATVAALDAIGALLAAAMLVLPAATARLVSDRMGTWQLATVAVGLVQGVGGLWLSLQVDSPPGAAIALVGGVLFVLVAAFRAVPKVGIGLAAIALVVGGCGSGDENAASGSVRVVATTTQLGDIVREVGGPAVEVTQLLQANTDPHDYEPRPSDIEATAHADLVVVNGDHLDEWIDEVVDNAGGDPTIIDAGAGRPVTRAGDEDEGSEFDPHWWHDPRNVEYAAAKVRDALIDAEPDRKAAITKSADAYIAKVKALDAGIADCIDTVPGGDRKLVTDHDAFGYFADRYGLTVVGAVIPSQTTSAQPSAGDLADLADVIRSEGVGAVFPESSVNPKLAEAIARETGASADDTLYGDTLGPPGSPGATYLTMEQANADAIVRGLTDGERGCSINGI